ncbi:MAG: ABC transporter ATP-binding protein [Candidatus Lokiarchaeia archaeon]
MENLVELRGVKKDYYLGKVVVHALRDISLSIRPQTFVSIVGPSGSGKTTLLNLIGCIDEPTKGEILILGKNVKGLNDGELSHFRSREIGFIFQSFNLIPVLSAYENIRYALFLNKCPKKEVHDRVMVVLKDVGLEKYRKHRPNELSGGQQQRVSIARALVTEPKLVLADEPTANLDTETGETIIDLMHKMKEKSHTTFIFSTHDELIMRHAEKKYILRDGVLLD